MEIKRLSVCYDEALLYEIKAVTDWRKKAAACNTATSMPWNVRIVEQLMKGPKEQGHLATMPQETRTLGVTVC